MKTTLYEALGIAQTASDEEVRTALRRLIRKYYARTRDGHGNVEEALRFINHASRILGDPERRVRYDQEIALSGGTTEQKIAHVNPVDNKSMNRFYPGKPDGTQTERASFAITREVVEKSDHLIDLHGGDIDESLRPYSYWTKTGNEKQDAISRDMVLAFGLDTIIISAERPKDPAASRYLENTASTRGKPSLTAEAGHAGTGPSCSHTRRWYSLSTR